MRAPGDYYAWKALVRIGHDLTIAWATARCRRWCGPSCGRGAGSQGSEDEIVADPTLQGGVIEQEGKQTCFEVSAQFYDTSK